MFNNVLKKIFTSQSNRILKKIYLTVAQINSFEPAIKQYSDAALKAKTSELKKNLRLKKIKLDHLLPEAFALVREAACRVLGQRHYDTQLLSGIILHKGAISEMKTGEGKTLASTLAAYLNALPDKGVHIITVNDYLARRDSEWMGQVFEFLGLTVSCIYSGMDEEERRAAYACDITYGTNNEFGFDYLKDNMKFHLDEMVQRPFHFAIIDEVDSILIDEARTPLIISGPAQDSSTLYNAIDALIPKLLAVDYELDEKNKNITLTDAGNEHIEMLLKAKSMIKTGNLYDIENVGLVHHVGQALRAHKLFQLNKDYIVKDQKIVIIDEFTGRMMEGRRFSDGLHQALEAKEKVMIQRENQTLASVTFQNYFRLYPKLAGMTGTALTEADEFHEIYGLDVIEVPTHLPIIRRDEEDLIYRTAQDKTDAIIAQVKTCFEKKQPVLIGTISIEESERLSKLLKKKKLKHHILNAKFHEKEADIIAAAGHPSAITIATNMAGRGTDIQLGGNLELRLKEAFASAKDAKKHPKLKKEIEAQHAADQETVKKAGGLFVLGTERHESRRIDNQLRGRSGRQGDPGSSKFFLSLEDDLMRIFGSERMDKLLKTFGLKEGEAITHPWVSKAIEKAQQKVEGHHFDMRKTLLKFDNVMNDQRTIIYEQRREIMANETVSETLDDMRADLIDGLIGRAIPKNSYPEKWDLEFLSEEILRLFGLTLPIKNWAKEDGIAGPEIRERIEKGINESIQKKRELYGLEMMQAAEKHLLLQILDLSWKDHLLSLDHIKQGINLRAYGQRDPLHEYKLEAFNLFEEMLQLIREKTIMMIAHVRIAEHDSNAFDEHASRSHSQMAKTRIEFGPAKTAEVTKKTLKNPTINAGDESSWKKTPRNAACPCGSGNKYKHCHGKYS